MSAKHSKHPLQLASVDYAFVDGMHFFTSKSTWFDGLCVGHADLETAFNEVAVQLNYLVSKNLKTHSNFKPGVTFSDFKKWLESAKTPLPKIDPAANNMPWAAAA